MTLCGRLASMTTAEVLQKARDLIADESRWTHGYYAKDESGHDVEPNEPSACRWCALGAVYHVLDLSEQETLSDPEAVRALDDAAGYYGSTVDVNDYEGHDAVLALYDRAIAAEAA